MATITSYPCTPCGNGGVYAWSYGADGVNQAYRGSKTGRVLLVPQSAQHILNVDYELPNKANVAIAVATPILITAGAYVANNLIAGPAASSTVLETAGGAVVVGAISSVTKRLAFRLTFPTLLADRTNVFMSFTDTTGKFYNINIAEALVSRPCAPAVVAQTENCKQFAGYACVPEVCGQDAPYLSINGRAFATLNNQGQFEPVGPGDATYTWDFTGVATVVVLTALSRNSTDIITANLTGAGVTLALQLADLAGQLNALGFGTFTSTATSLSIVGSNLDTWGNLVGTGNAVAFDLAPAQTLVDTTSPFIAYVQKANTLGDTGDCCASGTANSAIVVRFQAGVPCTSIVEYVNGVERVALTETVPTCTYGFDFTGLGTTLEISNVSVNGVNILDTAGALTGVGANLAAQLLSLSTQLTQLGIGQVTATATALSVRSAQSISLLAGRSGVGGTPVVLNILANGTGFGNNCA